MKMVVYVFILLLMIKVFLNYERYVCDLCVFKLYVKDGIYFISVISKRVWFS